MLLPLLLPREVNLEAEPRYVVAAVEEEVMARCADAARAPALARRRLPPPTTAAVLGSASANFPVS